MTFNRFDHDAAEAILSGQVPEGDRASTLLAGLIAEIRASSIDDLPPGLAEGHLAAITGSVANGPPETAAPAPGGRRRRRVAAILGTATAKMILGTATAIALTGGAAAAGMLPGPVQEALADAADTVGIHIPHSDPVVIPVADTTTTTTTTTTIAATTATTPTTPTTTASTTTTTSAAGAGVTTTTSPSQGPGGDDDDDDEGEDLQALVGEHEWIGASCDDELVAVTYAVTAEGILVLISVQGDDPDIEARDDQIEIEFDDDITVRIDLDRSGDEWVIEVGEDRDCDGDSETDGESDDTESSEESDSDDD